MPVKKEAKKTTKKEVKNEVAVVEKNEVAVVNDIPMDDIDLSQIDLTTPIKMNKMGKFVGKELESIKLGDTLKDCIITKARFQASLWRDKDIEGTIPEDEERLMFSIPTVDMAKIQEAFDKADEEHELTEKGYTIKNVGLQVYLEFEYNDSKYSGYFNKSSMKNFKQYSSAIYGGQFGNKKFETKLPSGKFMQLGRISKVKTTLTYKEEKYGKFSWVSVQFNFEGDVE